MPDEESLFDAARKLPPGQQREALLERECGEDAELRSKIKWLLRNQDAAGSFLEHPADTVNFMLDTDRAEGVDFCVRCPHCNTPLDAPPDAEIESVSCDSCGNHFSLSGGPGGKEREQIGHFRLVERVGEGGFGTVWKAIDTKLNRLVAVKAPRSGGFSPEQEKAFLREAQHAAQLNHPGIVPVFEVGRDGNTVYIVSEFVQGITLSEWLEDQQLTTHEAAELAIKIGSALHHAHERGVVHRDLKPGNIMLGSDQEPRLMDFGLARREVSEVTVSITGQILGTPAYMSPEQARGEGNRADRRSDIYSLGVVLFQLLTGELPFRGNLQMLLQQVLHDEPPSPRKLNANVSRDLETITLKCLQKDPSKRYPTARAVTDDLLRCLENKPILARPTSAPERVWRLVRRNPAVSTLTTAAAFSLLAGTIASSYFAIASHRSESRAIGEATRARDAEALALERESETLKQLGLAQIANANAAYLDEDPQRAMKHLDLCPEEHRDTNWRYLYKHCDGVLYRRQLSGIYGVEPDPGAPGNFFVYQSSGQLSYIEGKTGEILRQIDTTFTGCRMAVSDDGRRVALVRTRRSHRRTSDDDIVVLAAESFEELARWSGIDLKARRQAFFTAYSRAFVVGDSDRSVVIDIASGEQQTLDGFFAIASHPRSNQIYGMRGRKLLEMDLSNQEITREFPKEIGYLHSVDISHDGNRIVLAIDGARFWVYDLRNGKLLKATKAFRRQVAKVVFGNRNPDNLVAVGQDRRNTVVRFWNLGQVTHIPQKSILARDGAGTRLAWDERSGILLAGKRSLAAYPTPTRPATKLGVGGRQARFLSESLIGFSSDLGVSRRGLLVLDVATRKSVGQIPDYTHVVRSRTRETSIGAWLAHNEDNRIKQMVNLIQSDAPAPVSSLASIDLAAISPEMEYYASGNPRGVHVLKRTETNRWEPVLGHEEPEVKIPNDSVSHRARAFFPAAETPFFLASFFVQGPTTESRVYQLYNLETKELVSTNQFSAAATCLEIDPAGKLLVAGVPDGTIRGIDPILLEERFVFRAHDRDVTAVAIRPDGGMIASGDNFGLIRLWRTDELGCPTQLVQELLVGRSGVESLDFSPSGEQLACHSDWHLLHFDLSGLGPEPAKPLVSIKALHGLVGVEAFQKAVDTDDWSSVEQAAISTLALPSKHSADEVFSALVVAAHARDADNAWRSSDRVIQQYANKNEYWRQYALAYALLLMPPDVEHTKKIAATVERAEELLASADLTANSMREFNGCRSMLMYRQGKYRQALRLAESLIDKYAPPWRTRLMLFAAAALSHHQLGNTIQANEYFNRFEQGFPDLPVDSHQDADRYWLAYKTLLKEARAVIAPTEP